VRTAWRVGDGVQHRGERLRPLEAAHDVEPLGDGRVVGEARADQHWDPGELGPLADLFGYEADLSAVK
jgi:hypothetical protein